MGTSGFLDKCPIRFQVLHVFLVLPHDRRRILHWPVTFSLSSLFGISRLQG